MLLFENLLELELLNCSNVWHSKVQSIGRMLGFDKLLFGLVQEREILHKDPFIISNYPPKWRDVYDTGHYADIDPTVIHSRLHVTPIIWSKSLYKDDVQCAFREEAHSYGLIHGVSFPMHGPSGEFGIFSLCLDAEDNVSASAHISREMTNLIMLRDVTFQSALDRARKSASKSFTALTKREQEILQWSAQGKTSWEISVICGCSEANVNFHISNVKRKFGVTSRRVALLQALKQGLISL